MHPTRDTLDRLSVAAQPSAVYLGNRQRVGAGPSLTVTSPIDGSILAQFNAATASDVALAAAVARDAFTVWRETPAPQRGEFVRRYSLHLREHKADLARLIAWESGKITQEALGEVQEMIDVCDFALGLSRQLYGMTAASERPRHRLMEQWHPLGPVGIITAFNFPAAVWSWNAAIALVCGDVIVWKPSEKTPLTALACQALLQKAAEETPGVPAGVSSVLVGGPDVGAALAGCRDFPLVSATGSIPMGKAVGRIVGDRLGRSLLELGGNNAAIVAPSADLELTLRAITFAAVGTCGQRCTSLRRLIVHENVARPLLEKLLKVYSRLPIGSPLDNGVLVGPLIDRDAYEAMQRALVTAKQQGGRIYGGERITMRVPDGGYYVQPAIVEIPRDAPIIQEETFAPILYAMRYKTLDEAIALNNGVPQGLASSIFTNDLREAERFCGPAGSDCGIVNVNVGPSGAEIGGAFGGEKDTGGGRESGSDSWKAYMRRATNTVNGSSDLPLSQGVRFDVEED